MIESLDPEAAAANQERWAQHDAKARGETIATIKTTRQDWHDPAELHERLRKLQEIYKRLLEGHALYTMQNERGHLEVALLNGTRIVDTGKVVTANYRGNDPKATIDALVLMARAKGWQSVEMTGDEAFKKAAWLELAKVGIGARNYQPTPQTLDQLQDFQDQRRAQQQAEALRRQAEQAQPVAEPEYRAPQPGM